MKLHGYLAATALALSACAQADAPPPVTISAVEVTADVTSVANSEAAAYWGGLESDLASAVAAEFVGATTDDGWVVAIDVDEIALASFFQSQAGADDARLTGEVALIDRFNEVTERTFVVSATANQAAVFLPEGQDIATVSASSAEFYQAVLRAFARGVAESVRASAV